MPTALTTNPPPLVMDGEWRQESFGITAGQTFKPGDFVYLTSSGVLSIAATSGNDVGNVKIVGVSKGDAAQLLALYGSGAQCPVAVPTTTSRILLPLYHSTAASAVLAETDMDAPITLPLRNQGGIWCVNVENNGTNDRMLVSERHMQYAFAETFGWFYCKFVHGTTRGEAT